MAKKLNLVIAGDAAGGLRALGQINRGLGQSEGFAKRAGAMMGKALLGIGVAAGTAALAIGGLAVRSFGNFDDAMTKSLAIMGDVSADMRGKMSQAARDVAKTTTFSASQAAEAYYFLASAGLDAATSIGAMPLVAKFAQAGNFDLALATDLLTDAQSALGLKGKDAAESMLNMARVSDVLVKANMMANASVQQFSEALTNKAGAAMKSVGMDIEEGVAVLAAFADQGIKGEEAGTQFGIVLRDLQTQAIDNKDAFKKHNVAVYDAAGEMRNMGEIVEDVEDALDGMSDEQRKTTLATMGFTDKSIASLMALMGTSKAIKQYERDARSAGNTTDEVANKQLESFKSKLILLSHKFADIGLSIGEKLMPYLGRLADWVDEKMPEIESMIDGAFTAIDTAILKPIGAAVNFLGSLKDIAGWKGADFTDKIRISWTALSDQLEDWLDSPEMVANLSRPWEVTMGLTGEEKLGQWGAKAGTMAGQALAGILGIGGMGTETSTWGRAGRALFQGFKDAFMETDWSEVFWQAGENVGGVAVGQFEKVSDRPMPAGHGFGGPPKVKDYRDRSWFFPAWSPQDWDDWLNTPIGEKAADKAGAQVGPPLGEATKTTAQKNLGTIDGWMRPFVSDAPGTGTKIGTGVGGAVAKTGPPTGRVWGTGWKEGADAALKTWKHPSVSTIDWRGSGAQSGSGFGTDLLAELQGMMGPSAGFKGLSSHMNQLAGSIGARFSGLSMGSGFRPNATIRDTGKPSLHGVGRGTDWFGSSSKLQSAFDWLAINAKSFGIQELLYKNKAWSTGVPYIHTNTNARSVRDHMDHLHVGTRYHGGGEVPAVLKVGERVLTQEQNTWMDKLTKSATGGGVTVNIGTLNATNPAAAASEIVRLVDNALRGKVRARRLATA